MSIPQGDYAQMLDSYFGYLPQEQRNALWSQFTSSQGISPATTPTSNATKAQFLSFLQTNYDQNIIQDVLSPEEKRKRQLIFSVYDIIVTLMKTIQDSSSVSQDAVFFLTRYQKMYTEMASRVPVYQGVSSTGFNADFSDPSKFTLGFGNVSVTDIANYLLAPTKSDNSNASFTISTPVVSLTKPSTGTVGKINWSIAFNKAPNNNGWGTIQLNRTLGEGFNSPGSVQVDSLSVYIDPNASAQDQQSAWTSGILSFLGRYIRSTPVQVKAINPEQLTDYTVSGLFGWVTHTEQKPLREFFSDTDINYMNDNSIKTENGLVYVVWPRPASSEPLADELTNALNAAPTQMITPPPNKQFNFNWRFGNSDGDKYWDQSTFTSLAIPWRYTTENVPGDFGGSSDHDVQTRFLTETNPIVQSRAQTNQKNQQFISQIISKRQALKDRASEVQNSVQASMSSLKGQAGILQSTIQALKTILDRIYQ